MHERAGPTANIEEFAQVMLVTLYLGTDDEED